MGDKWNNITQPCSRLCGFAIYHPKIEKKKKSKQSLLPRKFMPNAFLCKQARWDIDLDKKMWETLVLPYAVFSVLFKIIGRMMNTQLHIHCSTTVLGTPDICSTSKSMKPNTI